MNYRIVFFVIALSVFLMGSVLFFVVSQSAKQTQTAVLEDHTGRELTSPSVTKGIFAVGQPAFEELDHACTVPFMDEVYINVVMRYREVPRSCEFFVNDRYVTSATDLQPDCIRECPTGEFSRTFAIGHYDVREGHSVRVCCNDICIEKTLRPLCPGSGPSAGNSS